MAIRPETLLESGSETAAIVYRGKFAADLTDVADKAEVIIPIIDKKLKFGPAIWMPRVDNAGSTVYPDKGDECLIIFDEAEEPWIIGWWPYG